MQFALTWDFMEVTLMHESNVTDILFLPCEQEMKNYVHIFSVSYLVMTEFLKWHLQFS